MYPTLSDMQPAIHGVMLGIDTPHARLFAVDRPRGLSEWLLLRFRTPMELLTADGPTTAEPGDALLFSPGYRQWYRGRGIGFRDDWLHFTGPGVAPLVRRLDLPINRVFTPRASAFIPRLFAEIAAERSRREAHWEAAEAHLIATLLLHLARQLIGDRTAQVGRHAERLRGLRQAMLADIARPWTVLGLARRAGLGTSRFQQLYRQLFGVPPIEDLIRARVEHARLLLSSAGASVAETAAAAGFGSIFHFSRTFRRRVGCAPREYHAQASTSVATEASAAPGPGR